ncbi:DUF418 domain-containing protein [Cryomorphaceae bacterium 1068]|nr:DUF418 domain-containing protein [Cryomorphaceae bacterium 1068]
MANNSLINPTSRQNRIQELDIFRGFAIFGIFMVNILVMDISFVYRGEWVTEQTGWIQDIPRFILEELFFGKFFTIFSFLFGAGVALQISKAKEKGSFSNLFFVRRFFSLFVFGVAHILFIWSGDILHIYGALGFLLLAFFRLKAKSLIWIASIIFLFPFYFQLVEWLINNQLGFDHMAPLADFSREQLAELKHNGSYLSGISLRLKEYSFVMIYVYAAMIPAALAMMLLGGAFVKKGMLNNLTMWVRKGRIIMPAAFVFFLAYRLILLYYVKPNFDVTPGSGLATFLMTIYYLADLIISLCYLWFLALVLQHPFPRKLLQPLANVGRMALSNYILQSLLGYFIMRTFNRYDTLSIAECVLIVIVIFSLQIIISKWWLSRFKFGPLEWLWRCISYWKILPIR